MRKGIVLLVITCIFSIGLSTALSASDLRWHAGLKGGADWAKLIGEPVSLWLGDGQDSQLAGAVGDNKVGFTGGGFLTVFFNDFFGLQTELMYVPKGGQGTASGAIVFYPPGDNPRPAFFDGEVYAYLDYVEIPLLAVFEFDAS